MRSKGVSTETGYNDNVLTRIQQCQLRKFNNNTTKPCPHNNNNNQVNNEVINTNNNDINHNNNEEVVGWDVGRGG